MSIDLKDPRNTRDARFRMELSRDEGEKTIVVVVPRQDIAVRRHGQFEIGPKVEPWKGATVRVAGYPGAWHVEDVRLDGPPMATRYTQHAPAALSAAEQDLLACALYAMVDEQQEHADQRQVVERARAYELDEPSAQALLANLRARGLVKVDDAGRITFRDDLERHAIDYETDPRETVELVVAGRSSS